MAEFSIEGIEYKLGEKCIPIKDFIDDHQRTLAITGISQIYESISSSEENAVVAARKLLSIHKKKPKILIYVTQSPTFILPGSGVLVHEKLGLDKQCLVFDINAGCSGFAQALILASDLVSSHDTILILCSDTYRKKLDSSDRSTMSVFSDASSAILVTNKPHLKIEENLNQVSGKNFKLLFQKLSTNDNKNHLYMSGRELWSFTREHVLPDINKILSKLEKKNINVKDIFVHQASKVVVNGITEHLNKKYIIHKNYMSIGNTVSSSIPILIKDSKVDINSINSVISGFGVGLISCTLGLKKN